MCVDSSSSAHHLSRKSVNTGERKEEEKKKKESSRGLCLSLTQVDACYGTHPRVYLQNMHLPSLSQAISRLCIIQLFTEITFQCPTLILSERLVEAYNPMLFCGATFGIINR